MQETHPYHKSGDHFGEIRTTIGDGNFEVSATRYASISRETHVVCLNAYSDEARIGPAWVTPNEARAFARSLIQVANEADRYNGVPA